MTTLVNTKGPSKKKKGRSKRAHVLVAAVEKATENFIERGEQIAVENPDIKQVCENNLVIICKKNSGNNLATL